MLARGLGEEVAVSAPGVHCGPATAAALEALAARLLERARRAGALANGGTVTLEAALDGPVLRLVWRESGGPEPDLGPDPALAAPFRARRLIEASGPCLIIEVPAASLRA